MILCHKCCGILAKGDNEDTSGLYRCGCMSGYVRGFEPNLNRSQAVGCQYVATEQRIKLYEEQGRPESDIAPSRERLAALGKLM